MKEQEVVQLDEKDYKIIAYREKVSELEEQVIDLRVKLTYLSQELEKALESSGTDDAQDED